MRRSLSRKTWTLVASSGIMLIFLVGIVWWATAQSSRPQYQQRATMPTMAGTEERFINLWVDPAQAVVGATTLTAQVTSTIGTPVYLDAISFELVGPDGKARPAIDAKPASGDGAPTAAFRAPARFDMLGSWTVTVDVRSGDVQRSVTFDLTVHG